MTEEGETRSGEARRRAERALVWLLHLLRDEEVELIVLGGLVPEMLTRGQEPPVPDHLGTLDVDVLLITHVEVGIDLGSVERALEEMEFEADPSAEGWRWAGAVEGKRVKIEFLCDLDTVAERDVIRPAGCRVLAAANLRGTGYVARDVHWEQLSGRLADGAEVVVSARFAGLQGYLLSKCVAVRTRAAEKDYYDFPYVLIHNREGGPASAATLLREGQLSDSLGGLRSTFLEVRSRYGRIADDGPRRYAEQMLLVDPSGDPRVLRQDAVSAVAEFFDVLLPRE